MSKLAKQKIVTDNMAKRYPGSIDAYINTNGKKDKCFDIAWKWYMSMFGYEYPKRNININKLVEGIEKSIGK